MDDKKCPKCGGEISEGDFHSWGKGASIWLGLSENPLSRFIGGKRNKVASYACKKCGYIERFVKWKS